MSRKKIFLIVFLSSALTISCFASVGRPQKGPQGTTGAPLKGVDVKLGKNPGGKPAARTATDGDGNFSFQVVPAGEYVLTVEVPQQNTTDRQLKYCYIGLKDVSGRKTLKGYDFEQKKAFDASIDPNKQTTSKIKFEEFVVHSDGTHPVNGTIVKSKSNISNN